MFRTRKAIIKLFLLNSRKIHVKHNFHKPVIATDKKTFQCLPVNKYTLRTHTCGELTINNVGDMVLLNGWVEYSRYNLFIILRDSYGSTQLFISKERPDLIETVKNLSLESVVTVTGEVVARPEGQKNENMATGEIEIKISSLNVLNQASSQLPFMIRDKNVPNEQLQLKYRYLSLRFPEIQRNLRIRSSIIHNMREYLIKCEFVDVETPTLFKKTPGGAQEFIVPTRFPGQFYALVQSPQQLKQLLMVGGIDRYFQIARCYRDEGSRNDRQPEFTQLDIEMSFTDSKGVMMLIENLLNYSLSREIKEPFKHMKYNDAMETYGTESPDLRIPYKIVKVSNTMEKNLNTYVLVFPNTQEYLTTSLKKKFKCIQQQYNIDGQFLQLKINENLQSIEWTQFKVEQEDVVFIVQGSKCQALRLLGRLRVEFTDILESQGMKIRSIGNEFLWVVDFPLFKLDNDDRLLSMHHPFTQPHPEDIDYLTTNPMKVRGLHYDLVMNGSEIGGGSIRIHNRDLQEKILNMLDIPTSSMQYLLEALSSGAPPHGGIALGVDRLVSLVCNASSIRNVIAFPKTMEGRDSMSGAPASISKEDEKMYHIKSFI